MKNIETFKLKTLRQLLKMSENEISSWKALAKIITKELKKRGKYGKN